MDNNDYAIILNNENGIMCYNRNGNNAKLLKCSNT